MDVQCLRLLILCPLLVVSAFFVPSRLWTSAVTGALPLSGTGGAYPEWADDWIRQWIDAQQEMQTAADAIPLPEGALGQCPRGRDKCDIRKWLPRRVNSKRKQLVPYVIWQTWKDTHPARLRYDGMNSMVLVNPEYDYALMTDEDCTRFICELADPRVKRAYELVVPKAAKADIWRLAITLRYGGIYADSDVKATHPFREYVWPNASAVSGLGGQRDLHQWLLIYTPNHPFIAEALRGIAENVIKSYEDRVWQDVTWLTGPGPFNQHGVHPVFKRNGCTILNATAVAEGLRLVREGDLCPETEHPEPIGLVQLYNRDYLGGSVDFKVRGMSEESKGLGEVHYHTYKTWELLFTNATGLCDT